MSPAGGTRNVLESFPDEYLEHMAAFYGRAYTRARQKWRRRSALRLVQAYRLELLRRKHVPRSHDEALVDQHAAALLAADGG